MNAIKRTLFMFYYKKDDKIMAKPHKNPAKSPAKRFHRCPSSGASQGQAEQIWGEE